MVLEHYRIPTAPFTTIPPRNSWPKSGFDPMTYIDSSAYCNELQTYPLFVKPASVSTGIGIGKNNKARNRDELIQVIEEISQQHPTTSLLVEQFLSGREFTVGLIGTGADAQVIGVREFVFLKNNPKFQVDPTVPYTNMDPSLLEIDVYCHALKKSWSPNPQQLNLDMSDPVAQSVADVALKAWRVLGCRDGGRIDIRHNSLGVPNFMEVCRIISGPHLDNNEFHLGEPHCGAHSELV